MTYPAREHLVPTMTVEAASNYATVVHGYVCEEAEKIGLPGDEAMEFAYDRFERTYGVGRWTVEHLRKLKAKSCDITVFGKLKAAYLDILARKVSKLQRQIANDRATDDDADLAVLEADAQALAAKIEAKKAARRLAHAAAAEEVAE